MDGPETPPLPGFAIREYADATDRLAVVALWDGAFPGSPSGASLRVIDRKATVSDGLFFVAADAAGVLGTVVAGYDGHRGWIYFLVVAQAKRRRGIGAALLAHAEAALGKRGCGKVCLQVSDTSTDIVRLYQKLGYKVEPRVSMAKVIAPPS
jgi:ribosomal protein S18 acetylase RimI-like enzyme